MFYLTTDLIANLPPTFRQPPPNPLSFRHVFMSKPLFFFLNQNASTKLAKPPGTGRLRQPSANLRQPPPTFGQDFEEIATFHEVLQKTSNLNEICRNRNKIQTKIKGIHQHSGDKSQAGAQKKAGSSHPLKIP